LNKSLLRWLWPYLPGILIFLHRFFFVHMAPKRGIHHRIDAARSNSLSHPPPLSVEAQLFFSPAALSISSIMIWDQRQG
jgi:hypothetical protein